MTWFLFFQRLGLVLATSSQASSLNTDTQQGSQDISMGMGGTQSLTSPQTSLALFFHPRGLNVGWKLPGRQKEDGCPISDRVSLTTFLSLEADPSWTY